MPRGSLGGLLGPRVDQGSPREAPGSLGAVSGASLGAPKSLLLGGEYVTNTKVLELGRYLMKRRDFQVSIVFPWFSVTSPVRNREVNSFVKLIQIEDSQVEPLSKMKKTHGRKVEIGM